MSVLASLMSLYFLLSFYCLEHRFALAMHLLEETINKFLYKAILFIHKFENFIPPTLFRGEALRHDLIVKLLLNDQIIKPMVCFTSETISLIIFFLTVRCLLLAIRIEPCILLRKFLKVYVMFGHQCVFKANMFVGIALKVVGSIKILKLLSQLTFICICRNWTHISQQ